jgi:hypothetical protein
MPNDDALSPVTPQRERFNYLRGCLAADPPRIFRHLTVGDIEDLLAAADQLERNAEVLTLSTAPKPNDSPYSPAPDGRCERCDRINCIIREHLDHGEFAHAGGGRYGCVEEILRALESLAPPEAK